MLGMDITEIRGRNMDCTVKIAATMIKKYNTHVYNSRKGLSNDNATLICYEKRVQAR